MEVKLIIHNFTALTFKTKNMERGNITEVHLTTVDGNQVIYSYNEHGQMIGSKCRGKDRIKKLTEQERLEKALLKRSADCLTFNENYL